MDIFSTGQGLTTVAMIVAVVGLWAANPRVWVGLYATAIAIALYTGSITPVALVSLSLFGWLIYVYTLDNKYSVAAFGAAMIVGTLFGLHVLPGFNNLQYISDYRLNETTAAFSVWFNYNKVSVGILIFGIIFHKHLIRSFSDLGVMCKAMFPVVAIGLPLVYAIGLMLGYTDVDWTPSAVFIPWAIKNLFFTVLAEEAFFRGLIQRQLAATINSKHAAILAILIGGVLFGVAHFGGGVYYVLLASVAGCVYGYAYHVTGRIEAAILTHFLLNAGHFLFFSYPYLA